MRRKEKEVYFYTLFSKRMNKYYMTGEYIGNDRNGNKKYALTIFKEDQEKNIIYVTTYASQRNHVEIGLRLIEEYEGDLKKW